MNNNDDYYKTGEKNDNDFTLKKLEKGFGQICFFGIDKN